MLQVINLKVSSASIFVESDRHSVTLEEVSVRGRGGCHGNPHNDIHMYSFAVAVQVTTQQNMSI